MISFSLEPRDRVATGIFTDLFHRWYRLGFEPNRCRTALERMLVEHDLGAYFDPSGVSRGDHFVTDRLLRDPCDYDTWRFGANFDGRSAACLTDGAGAGDLGQLVLAWASADPEFEGLWSDVFGSQSPPARDREVRHGVWPDRRAPELVRREHASVLLDSGQTRVLTDPQCFERSFTTDAGRYPVDPTRHVVDAICITHSHRDHFSLASIIGYCHRDTKVIVPPVDSPNLLALDMRRCCELVGLDVVAPRWGEVVRIGDIDIEILPFYGEQPTRRSRTTPAGVRNCGSCYRFNLPTFSAAVLADSGEDPEGVVYAALRGSVSRFGPIDVVLSCFAEFPEIINPGLVHYMVTQPFSLLQRTYDERARGGSQESITFGASGVAQVCRAAQASTLLPYAHGFAGVGTAPLHERQHLARVAEALGTGDVATRLGSWLPGDRFVPSRLQRTSVR
jgi:L-ascorbate metabolism protein UlaG (beta-lactamase superfamily)